VGFAKIGKLDDIPPGTVKVYQLPDREIAVCNAGGRLYAIDNVCTHDGGSLDQGELIGFEVECPRHGARFDVRSGDVTEEPAVLAVDTFPVRLHGDDIEVDV
jgi:3-phenylpropionate/trans-cinnamate dioxygenase ferredoxin subunit